MRNTVNKLAIGIKPAILKVLTLAGFTIVLAACASHYNDSVSSSEANDINNPAKYNQQSPDTVQGKTSSKSSEDRYDEFRY